MTLDALQVAAREVEASRVRFFATLKAAHDAGHTYTAIGEALGMTRQAAQQLGAKAEQKVRASA